ncbi:MAG: MFS transporter [Acidobacteria bacterium]|nr:MFS transporter [Acidobacteriota bacterium]
MTAGAGPRAVPLWTRSFALVVVATATLFVGFYFMLPVLPTRAAALGAATSRVGFVITVYSLASMVTRVLSGPRMERHGARPFALAGLALFAATAVACALAASYPGLLTARIVQGIGWGWATTALGALVAELAPVARRGEAIGYWGLAPTLAMAVGPLGGDLLERGAGPAGVFLGTAALALLALFVVLPVRESRAAPGGGVAGRRLPRPMVLPALVLYLSSLSYGALVAYVPVELASRGAGAGTFFTVFAIAVLLTRPLAGRFSDVRGRGAIILPGLLLGAAGTLVLGFARTPLGVGTAALLYGFGIGGASFPGLLAWSVDRCEGCDRSTAVAWFFTSYDLAIASGAALLGPLYARFGFAGLNVGATAGIVLSLALFVAGVAKHRAR